MNNEKCLFKQVERAKVLQGRTITYLAQNKIGISVEYLNKIINGRIHCSRIIANRIVECIGREAKFEDYFEVID